jgi:hypothetical protein
MKNIPVEKLITGVACLILANAISRWWFGTKTFIEGDLYAPLTVVALGWCLALFLVPRKIL